MDKSQFVELKVRKNRQNIEVDFEINKEGYYL